MSAKQISSLDFELKCDVTLKITKPLVVAFHESTVLLYVRGESVEGGTHIALFIALKMLSHVVTEE